VKVWFFGTPQRGTARCNTGNAEDVIASDRSVFAFANLAKANFPSSRISSPEIGMPQPAFSLATLRLKETVLL
jgi:hypothetical protein